MVWTLSLDGPSDTLLVSTTARRHQRLPNRFLEGERRRKPDGDTRPLALIVLRFGNGVLHSQEIHSRRSDRCEVTDA